MKLYEAIALGRHLIEPQPGRLLSIDNTKGCALGMAYMACGSDGHWPTYILRLFNRRAPSPCRCIIYKDMTENNLWNSVVHLFDSHVFGAGDWTLDQLIDWVKSIEDADESNAIPSASNEPIKELEFIPVGDK